MIDDDPNLEAKLDSIVDALRNLPAPTAPDGEFRNRLVELISTADGRPLPFEPGFQQRRLKMRWSVAAASLLLISALAAMLMMPSAPSGSAFARMLELVGNARTVAFKTQIDMPQASHQMQGKTMMLGSDWIREEMVEGKDRHATILIQNLSQRKSLVLDPAKEKATRRDMAKVPFGAQPKNFIEQLRDVRESSAQLLGNEKTDGKNTRKYRCDHPTGNYLIWVAANSDLPVRVEISQSPGGATDSAKITITDFEWNAPLDESLFTLDVPKGYTLETESPPPALDVNNLIATMRLVVRLNNNQFPDEYNALTVGMIPKLVDDPSLPPKERKANRRRKLIQAMERPDLEKLSEAEWSKVGQELARTFAGGAVFLQVLSQTNEWHYVGKGVKLGDADKVVAWWAPKAEAKKDQETTAKPATVLYGDFHTEAKPVAGLPRAAK